MATGDTLAVLSPRNADFPNGTATAGQAAGVPTVDFDATTDEYCVFECVMPSNYSNGGVHVDIYWVPLSDTNIAHLCYFEAATRSEDTATDIDTWSYSAAQSGNSTCPSSVNKVQKTRITFTHAQFGSLVANTPFGLKINRDANHAS